MSGHGAGADVRVLGWDYGCAKPGLGPCRARGRFLTPRGGWGAQSAGWGAPGLSLCPGAAGAGIPTVQTRGAEETTC